MRPLAAGLNQAVQQASSGCGTPREGRSGVSASESGRQRPRCAVGRHGAEDLGHVGVDGLLAGRGGDGYPMMAVADEVQAGYPVDLDRWDRRAAGPVPAALSGSGPGWGCAADSTGVRTGWRSCGCSARYSVDRAILRWRAMAVTDSPRDCRARATARTSSLTTAGRPPRRRWAWAARSPSRARSRMRSRSVSVAIAATMNSILSAMVAPSGRWIPAQMPVSWTGRPGPACRSPACRRPAAGPGPRAASAGRRGCWRSR